MTITEKRANLLREWVLACYGNDERYYWSTASLCIPDGETYDIIVEDLSYGFYDDEIDEMLAIYRRSREKYAKFGSGWYINGVLIYNETEVLKNYRHQLPIRIYKKRW